MFSGKDRISDSQGINITLQERYYMDIGGVQCVLKYLLDRAIAKLRDYDRAKYIIDTLRATRYEY